MKYLFILSLIIISVFAFSPGQYTPAFIVNHDKTAHVLTFFVLTFLMQYTFRTIVIYKIMMLAMLLGVTIELIQLLFTSRGFSFEDLIYDVIGITIYGITYLLIYSLQKINKSFL